MKYVPIHTLRVQCRVHKLDLAYSFVLTDNENPTEAFKQLQIHKKVMWPKDHGCKHNLSFRWITDKEYQYNVKTKEAVKI